VAEQLLINATDLARLIADQEALVFDCRFDLMHPDRGRNSWLAAHIPGAVYAHMDDNLAGRITSQSGRHPLPFPRSFAAFLARSGWKPGVRVVAYDAHGGALASRFWWLMKYFGFEGVSLLDGGIGAWMTATLPMESGEVKTKRHSLPELEPHPEMTLNTQGVLNELQTGGIQLIDARAENRFEGLSEPIDTVAGHIPGALNHPTDRNVTDGTFFRTGADLRNGFKPLIGKRGPSAIVSMCGSGVTACQNLFAMELAGLKGGRLYPGSWSEWIRNPSRPVVKGAVQPKR
jgi:thiosulfate/3-mercaptopyruvate sulfurtransferase